MARGKLRATEPYQHVLNVCRDKEVRCGGGMLAMTQARYLKLPAGQSVRSQSRDPNFLTHAMP